MKARINRTFAGVVLGLVIPVITLLIYNKVTFDHLTAPEFFRRMLEAGRISAMISLGVIPDVLVFFIFIRLDYLYSARGVLAATVAYALLAVITRFLI